MAFHPQEYSFVSCAADKIKVRVILQGEGREQEDYLRSFFNIPLRLCFSNSIELHRSPDFFTLLLMNMAETRLASERLSRVAVARPKVSSLFCIVVSELSWQAYLLGLGFSPWICNCS